MKKLFIVFLAILAAASARAVLAVSFSASGLPARAGQMNCACFSTNNPDVPAMLVLSTNGGLFPGSNVTWDFSPPLQTNETVLRTTVLAAADGADGGDFPAAAWVEDCTQETSSVTNPVGWAYFSLTNQGRLYYGTETPNTAADGLAVFVAPSLDVPATVTNGQTWTRTTSWDTVFDEFFTVHYQFSATAGADASGTLVLPNIGAVPALRVHEVHAYLGTNALWGPVDSHTNQYYYWLVPGLGKAVEILQLGYNIYDPNLPCTNTVQRLCYASYFTNPPPPALTASANLGNLRIVLQSGSARLNWGGFAGAPTNYQVQASGSPAGANWQVLGVTPGTNWTDPLSPTQRFYRVLGEP